MNCLWCALCGDRIWDEQVEHNNDFDLCDVCVGLACGKCSGDEPCHDCIRERIEFEESERADMDRDFERERDEDY